MVQVPPYLPDDELEAGIAISLTLPDIAEGLPTRQASLHGVAVHPAGLVAFLPDKADLLGVRVESPFLQAGGFTSLIGQHKI